MFTFLTAYYLYHHNKLSEPACELQGCNHQNSRGSGVGQGRIWWVRCLF